MPSLHVTSLQNSFYQEQRYIALFRRTGKLVWYTHKMSKCRSLVWHNYDNTTQQSAYDAISWFCYWTDSSIFLNSPISEFSHHLPIRHLWCQLHRVTCTEFWTPRGFIPLDRCLARDLGLLQHWRYPITLRVEILHSYVGLQEMFMTSDKS